MPQAIVYCDRCGRIIPPGEISRGQALVGDSGGICQTCASTLTPEQCDALRMKLTGEMPAAPPPRPAAARPLTTRMSARGPAPAGASHRRSARVSATGQPEPGPKGSGGFQKHIAVAGAVAGMVVGITVALLVASRGKDPGAGGTTSTDAGQTSVTTTTTTTPPPAATPAEKSLSEIRGWAADLPTRYHDVVEALKQFPARFPGAPEVGQAKALLEEVEARHAKLADAELGKAIEDAKARAAGEMAAEAPRVLEDLRVRYAGSKWFETRGETAIEAAVGEIERLLQARAEEELARARKVIAEAEKALEADDLSCVRQVLAARANWPAQVRPRVDELLREVVRRKEAARAEAEKELMRAEAWRTFLVELKAKGAEGLKGVKTHLDRGRTLARDAGKSAEHARLAGLLRKARNLEELAAIGFEGSRRVLRLQWKDKPVGGRVVGVKDGVLRLKPPTVGDPVDVPICELAPENIVDESGLKPKPLQAAIYFMMRGDLEEARKRIADAGGEKVRALRDEIEDLAEATAPPAEPEPEPAPATLVEAPPEPPGTALISAGEPRGGWTFDNGQEFPGAKGALALDDTVPPERRPALKLDGDFTGGGGYVQCGLNLPPTAVEAVTFAIRSPGSKLVTMRLLDSSNQCHQIRLRLDGRDDWQEVRFPIGEFFRHVAAGTSLEGVINYERWGGPNDGRWHGPCKGIYILLGKGDLANGPKASMWLSRVVLLPPGEVPDGLVGWWKLDETAGKTIRDYSGKGFDGSLGGGEWRPTGGKRGGALASGANAASASFPGPTGPMQRFSVAFWLNPAVVRTHNQQVCAEGHWGRFAFHAGDGGAAWCGISVGSRFEDTDLFPGIVETGKWQHFAFTYDKGPSRFYKGGVLIASKTLATPEDWRGFTFYDVEGAIDDLRVYDRPLSPAEVKALAGGALSAPGTPPAGARGLVAYLKLDEKKGAIVTDASGNEAGGMIRAVGQGGYGWKPDGGKAGGALELRYRKVPGSNRTEGAHVEIGNALKLNPTDAITVACWIKPKTRGGYGFYWPGLVTKPGQYQLRLHEVNKLAFEVWLAGGGSAKVTVESPPAGEWHHVAGSYDGKEVKVFVDGQPKGSSPAAGRMAATANAAVVGFAPGNEPKYYDGLLDEVRIYDRALGAGDMLALLDAEATTAAGYVTGLFGEYFEGKDLNPAKLKLSRVDMNVSHDWGEGVPAPGMPGDGFSVHWSGELKVPAEGAYTFEVDRDDGARMKIGGRSVIDNWSDTAGRDTASVALKAGWVPFDFTYKENNGGAKIHLWWSGPGVARTIVTADSFRTARDPDAAARAALPGGPKEPLPGETGKPGEWAPGLVCEMFKGYSLTERVGVRIDPFIDFDFGGSAPDLGLDAGPYVLRWTGYLLAPYDGRYRSEPEGVTVKLDGRAAPVGGEFEMKKGLHKLEAVCATGASRGKAIFRWRLEGAKDRRVVPSSHFYHDVPGLGSMGPPAKTVSGLRASYFAGEVPRGRAIEATVGGPEYDLSESPPCTKLPKDQFSVRLEGHYLANVGGKYLFQLVADDGGQFFLDDKLVIDCWQKAADDPTATLQITPGWHKIAVAHRERRGKARLELRWRPPWGRDDQGKPVFEWWPSNCFFREPGEPELVGRKGLTPGIDCAMFEGDRPGAGRKILERLDPHLESDWRDDMPGLDVPEDNFSASWRGNLLVPESGAYVFSLWRRGGLVFGVGSTSLAKDWSQGDKWIVTKPIRLRAGAVPFVLDYFSRQGDPGVKVYWAGPGFQLRRLGDGDLVRRAKKLELAASWWKKPDEVATTTPKPDDRRPGPAPKPDEKPKEAPPAGNLVSNGGFEERDDERKFAARWTKGQWGKRGAKSAVRPDKTNPRTGDVAMSLRAIDEGTEPGVSTTLKLVPAKYEVRFWACAKVGERADVRASLAGRDLPVFSVGDDYRQFTGQVEIAKKELQAALRISLATPLGRAWIDDVEVEAVK